MHFGAVAGIMLFKHSSDAHSVFKSKSTEPDSIWLSVAVGSGLYFTTGFEWSLRSLALATSLHD